MGLNYWSAIAKKQGLNQPHLEALNLLALVTAMPQTQILRDDFVLSLKQRLILRWLIKRRQKLPLAYLQKSKDFYGLEFHVNRHTLIPRPDSEDLVDLALELPNDWQSIYDIGCGSGCLGISYRKYSSCSAPLVLVDKSVQAVIVAKRNALKHRITKTSYHILDINHLQPNWFPTNSLILANLPYLDINRRREYQQGCREINSEPKSALYSHQSGLGHYQVLFSKCQGSQVTIICESLPEQQTSLDQLALRYGFKLYQRRNLASVFKRKFDANSKLAK